MNNFVTVNVVTSRHEFNNFTKFIDSVNDELPTKQFGSSPYCRAETRVFYWRPRATRRGILTNSSAKEARARRSVAVARSPSWIIFCGPMGAERVEARTVKKKAKIGVQTESNERSRRGPRGTGYNERLALTFASHILPTGQWLSSGWTRDKLTCLRGDNCSVRSSWTTLFGIPVKCLDFMAPGSSSWNTYRVCCSVCSNCAPVRA